MQVSVFVLGTVTILSALHSLLESFYFMTSQSLDTTKICSITNLGPLYHVTGTSYFA